MINPYLEIDYLEEARTRYTEQFKNKIVFDKHVELFLNEFTELQDVFKDLMQLRSIDTATGVQLDIIGNIVGQPREVFDVLIYNFGFDNVTGTDPDGASSQTFGTLSDPLLGGYYRSLSDSISGARYLNDTEYRTLIKAKIIKNTSNGTINDIILSAQILFNEDALIINDDSLGYLEIDLNRPWSDASYSIFTGVNEKILAEKYLPIPIGVELGFGS